jgi:hypothetical protein
MPLILYQDMCHDGATPGRLYSYFILQYYVEVWKHVSLCANKMEVDQGSSGCDRDQHCLGHGYARSRPFTTLG